MASYTIIKYQLKLWGKEQSIQGWDNLIPPSFGNGGKYWWQTWDRELQIPSGEE